jgi:hypothetical protein
MRQLWLMLGVALVLASPSAARDVAVDRGIIVGVRPPFFALRELDGSRMRFTINRSTIITLDGRRVHLARLQRGDVAAVRHQGRFVVAIRAFRA